MAFLALTADIRPHRHIDGSRILFHVICSIRENRAFLPIPVPLLKVDVKIPYLAYVAKLFHRFVYVIRDKVFNRSKIYKENACYIQ